MTTYVIRNGELIEKHLVEPLSRPDAVCGYISDHMEPTLHMANGKRYTSKHKFRQATKDYGCVEVGDQKNYGKRQFVPTLSKERRVEDIKRAINGLSDGKYF